ncbi:rod shape-determining protein MreC [Ideonella dechloratans]|uniref:Cell shape-determining protein MreC n=1 Tax=Ideonella dechloratans TaxID=36863 RepID=A0A643FBS0_IDEDE|nr:rod shape-determining protein MreC [Ideonella dechloratans]KAB0580727.1 rod shape-determining protein MreC [Ideonella dechloratans]UFU09933.1 rod shape-determining protein MreC [Ideonella dechloratans]
MPLGTLDRNPPPFFHQGPSALSRLLLAAALAIFLMAADHRFALIQPLRNALATGLLPAVRVLGLPVALVGGSADYIGGLDQALARNQALQRQLTAQAEQTSRAERLTQENAQLRGLLGLRPATPPRSQVAEVLYEAPDPYVHKLFIDRGTQQGVTEGMPVMNEHGILGQVTRAYLLSSEVTLLADRDATIPVLNARTQHRAAAFGSGDEGQMELRFVAANDDVKVGDTLLTSGVDGIYPAGVPVATVTSVNRQGEGGFAHIGLSPVAKTGGLRFVLLVGPVDKQADTAVAAAVAAASAAASAASAASANEFGSAPR